MRRTKGFSLIELMVTLVVLGVLLAIAVPNFTAWVSNSRSQAAANELMSALNSARTEAVKRGKRVSVCPSTDGASCSGTSWQIGWIVFVDTAASDLASSATVGTVLNRRTSLSGGATITGNASFIRFSGLGTAPVRGNGSIAVQASQCTGQNARTISISSSGRLAMSKAICS